MTSFLRSRGRDDSGFTLVETLVGSMLMVVVLTMTLGVATSTGSIVGQARDTTDLNEEARVALNRISRELREASAITSVTNPAQSPSLAVSYASPAYAATADSAMTFEADFNGSNGIEPNATDPEVVTYRFDRTNSKLLLQAGGQTLPVLASNVTSFKLSFTSRLIAYDGTVTGAAKDGVVTWEELDADPAALRGNGNKRLDALELGFIDSVVIEMTLFRGKHEQIYRTQVDLRNRPY